MAPARPSGETILPEQFTSARPERRSDRATGDEASNEQWRSRPLLAFAVRLGATVAPILAVLAVVDGLSTLQPEARKVLGPIWFGGAFWWAIMLGASAFTAILIERSARRLVPLSLLLRLTLVFPDQAPSRYKVMRAAANPARLKEIAASANGPVGDAAGQVLLLIAALARHDKHTRGHSERVRVFSDLIAEQLGIEGIEREKLRWSALLHDIGKMSVPAEILNKPGRPDAREWATLQGHPAAGRQYVGSLFEWLGPWAGGITEHHERFDGKGYPFKLSGNDITLGGRIVAIADCYETMTAARSYKKPMATKEARQELADCAGTQFDPEIVRAFLAISLPKLFWRLGPLSLLIHLPFLSHLGHAPQVAARLAAGTSTIATPAAVAGLGMATAITTTAVVGGIAPAAKVSPAPGMQAVAASTATPHLAWTSAKSSAAGGNASTTTTGGGQHAHVATSGGVGFAAAPAGTPAAAAAAAVAPDAPVSSPNAMTQAVTGDPVTEGNAAVTVPVAASASASPAAVAASPQPVVHASAAPAAPAADAAVTTAAATPKPAASTQAGIVAPVVSTVASTVGGVVGGVTSGVTGVVGGVTSGVTGLVGGLLGGGSSASATPSASASPAAVAETGSAVVKSISGGYSVQVKVTPKANHAGWSFSFSAANVQTVTTDSTLNCVFSGGNVVCYGQGADTTLTAGKAVTVTVDVSSTKATPSFTSVPITTT